MRMRKNGKLHTVADLIDAVGGQKELSKLLNTTPQNVWNWKTAGKIPARFLLLHRRKLEKAGLKVADSCWGFAEAA